MAKPSIFRYDLALMSVKVSRILHAGYLFEYNGHAIAFDPLFENPFSVNCFAFPEIEFEQDQIASLRFDAVFISHYHDDHFSLESLNHLDRATPIYLFSVFDEHFNLLMQMGFTNVIKLILNHTFCIFDFQITVHPALDQDVDSIIQIQVNNLNFLNVVDSWIAPEVYASLRKIQWDLVLWPMQSMRELEVLAPFYFDCDAESAQKIPQEHLDQISCLDAKLIIASSCQFKFEEWSWLNKSFFPISYKNFTKQVSEINQTAKVLRLDPGQSIEIDHSNWQRTHGLSWIHPIGDQNVDYEFDPKNIPQTTNEIAQFLPKTSKEQNCKLMEFCTALLPQKFDALIQAGYFSDVDVWRLKIYFHADSEIDLSDVSDFNNDQRVKEFKFHFKSNSQSLISKENSLANEWITEICAVKLWGALFESESLTSLYLRIFPPSSDQRDCDLLADPLITAIYLNKVSSYQNHQLSKIQMLNRVKNT